jgi:hypothetical protein
MDNRSDQDVTADRILTIYDGTADGVVEALASFVSFQADGVTINWTDAPASAFLITAIFFAGTDLSVSVGRQDLGNTADALIANTGVGFEADVVLAFWNSTIDQGNVGIGVVHNNRAGTVTQRGISHSNRNTFSASQAASQMRDGEAISKLISTGGLDYTGEFKTFDSSGWDVQLGGGRAPANADYAWLAMRFGSSPVVGSKVYTYTTPTATGSNTDSNPGFTPQFIMYLATRAAVADTIETDADGGTIGVVLADADEVYTQSISDEDAAADSNTQSLSDDRINLPTHTGAAGHEATLTNMGSTGPVWNYGATDTGTARLWGALAIENFVAAEAAQPSSSMYYPDIDETYNVEYDYSGHTNWQTPTDVIPIDESIRQELPQIDETYYLDHNYSGWVQAPMRADVFAIALQELPQIDETYNEEHNYNGFVSWQTPTDVIAPTDITPRSELPQIDETFYVRYNYQGHLGWPMPANVEDFQSLAELPVIDETYDVEYDYLGHVSWQIPGDVIEPYILPEATQIDETYSEEHDYSGFVTWQTPGNVEDFQPLAELPRIDETYDVEYDYSGIVQSPFSGDVAVLDSVTLPELATIDDTYSPVGYSYSGWTQSPLRASVQTPIQAQYPVIGALYDLFYGHNFDGMVSFPIGNRPNILLELDTYLVRAVVPTTGEVLLKQTTGKARLIKNPSAEVKFNDTLYGE